MAKDVALKILDRVRPDLITEDSAQKLDDKIQIVATTRDDDMGTPSAILAAVRSGALGSDVQTSPSKRGMILAHCEAVHKRAGVHTIRHYKPVVFPVPIGPL